MAGVSESALELLGLSKRYGKVTALDGVSFAVGEGQMFGFVGPNGAGKTTAMRIVLGVLAADAGEVVWRGRPIGAEERRRIGYMPEERGLYPKMRVRDQLSYMAELHGLGPEEAQAAAGRWMQRLGIAERAEEPVEALSLGNQQRVQLAVALVHEPDLLILDEPFSGLDPDGVDALSGALRDEIEARGVPVIFSSLAQIGTFLPPMAPMLVPGRAAQGALAGWELAASLALMAVSILIVVRVAGRIYGRSVLRFGSPMKLREALALSRRR
jgi:ABC-2 type transport system ATP-binding protein